MYQIFVDRFCNGDPTNDVEDNEYIYIGAPSRKVKDWNQAPEAMDIRNFYGGDLQGVLDKLDYLQDLGVEVIYFNPLFVSPILKFKVGSLKAGISYDIGLSDYQVDGRKNGMLFSLGFDLQNPWGARFD